MYDTADYAYTPAWLQTGDYEIDCIDGKLALFQTSDGERPAVYAEQPFLSWRTGSSGVYVFREQDILHCSYDGSSEETLYAAQDGTIISFAAAGDVLFFAEKRTTASAFAACMRRRNGWTFSMTQSARMRRSFSYSRFPTTSCVGAWTTLHFWNWQRSRSRPTSKRGTLTQTIRAPTGHAGTGF